ncbi:MAG: hypothetical protein A2Z27_00120 [candidate division Zixibacteria bacterium RBG_16_50_21]|nr:MAG: hypothetical protein A2Z27_00120 [candidate division Zixibacteria bacterium RBG_16_50_21]
MKAISAKCGHVKRRLNQGKPLEGKVLEFALSVVEGGMRSSNDDFLKGIADKLKAGEKLSEYEHHIMVDVLLLHIRLGAA